MREASVCRILKQIHDKNYEGGLGGTGMPGGHARVSLSFTVGQPALKKSIS